VQPQPQKKKLSSCVGELSPMLLSFEHDTEMVKVLPACKIPQSKVIYVKSYFPDRTHTHTHRTDCSTRTTHAHDRFTALFPGPGWASVGRNELLLEGKITQADISTIRTGTTPSGLISRPPPSSPYFYAACPSSYNPPALSWLGTGIKYAGLHTQWPAP